MKEPGTVIFLFTKTLKRVAVVTTILFLRKQIVAVLIRIAGNAWKYTRFTFIIFDKS